MMQELKITIKVLSPVLLSNGEPEGLYDDTYIRDKYGLPYFPPKRLKGLLRESCLELLEWSGEVNKPSDVIDFIFGRAGESDGTSASRIYITNGEIENKHGWIATINKLGFNPEMQNAVDSLFSQEVAQTRIGENGIAEDHSLRKFKLLKPVAEACFHTTIKWADDLTDDHINLIKSGLLNIRRVGTGRNRGWGKVKVKINGTNEVHIPDWSALKPIFISKDSRKDHNTETAYKDNDNISGSFETIALKIKSESPFIIPEWTGDENTVATKNYIPGSMIWGAIAGKYIHLFGKRQNKIINDPVFRALFYGGGAHFQTAFPAKSSETSTKIYLPSPRHWVRSKLDPEDPYTNLYDESVEFGKPLGQFTHLDFIEGEMEPVQIRKSQSFHNSRAADPASRLAGTNMEGGIYYYESIDEGQTFYTEINVAEELVSTFRELLEDGKLRIGKSKNNQFGRASVEIVQKIDQKNHINDQERVDITFLTPTILINHNGFSDISIKRIAESLGIKTNAIVKSDIRTEFVQRYQGNLNVHLSAYQAIAPGSSLRIKNIDKAISKRLNSSLDDGIGLETEKGFGRIKIDQVTPKLKLKLKDSGNIEEDIEECSEADQDLLDKLVLEMKLKDARQTGFKSARGKKEENKNGVYQALKWLASCDGDIDNDKWENFKKRSSHNVNEKFIKRHDLMSIYKLPNNASESLKASAGKLRYTAALAYVGRLKTYLNQKS